MVGEQRQAFNFKGGQQSLGALERDAKTGSRFDVWKNVAPTSCAMSGAAIAAEVPTAMSSTRGGGRGSTFVR